MPDNFQRANGTRYVAKRRGSTTFIGFHNCMIMNGNQIRWIERLALQLHEELYHEGCPIPQQ